MSERIESVLQEGRRFSPPEGFRAEARLSSLEEYRRLYRQSLDDPERFWGSVAEELHWFKPWDRITEWREPFVKWFVGGETNPAYNCLDRQIELGRGNKVAFFWEGEPGDSRVLTFQQLHREVSRFANALKSKGVGKGDRVAIYMPMIPEAAVAMLACARIGATHSVVFGGFSAQALADRIIDGEIKAVVTADGGQRRGRVLPLKPAVDEALTSCPSVEHVFVVRRSENEIEMKPGPRPLVPRRHPPSLTRLSRRTARCRAPTVHPLHLRIDGQAEGGAPHHRRLPDLYLPHQQVYLRPEA